MVNYIVARYVWIGGNGEYRCKSRTFNEVKEYTPENLPDWSYDGSSTGQAEGHDSEVLLKPVAVFKDPIRGEPHIIVFCSTYSFADEKPLANNNRHWAEEIFNQNLDEKPWYGLEQEYFIMKPNGTHPAVEPYTNDGGFVAGQGQYYCSVGTENAMLRDLVDEHYFACLNAGISMSGINGEVAIAQWEFQVGPVEGIAAGDQLHVARFLLVLLAEKYNVAISFHPKPFRQGCWNGSGCHCNYSTKSMREDGGLDVIYAAIKKLEAKHAEHIAVYGTDNDMRLTGIHETADINTFRYGVADRGASVRIPRQTEAAGKGYLEDRRPASNLDPYLVTAKLFETTVL